MGEQPNEQVVIHREAHLAVDATDGVIGLSSKRECLLRKPWHTRQKPMRHPSHAAVIDHTRMLVDDDAITMHKCDRRICRERFTPRRERPRQVHVIGVEPRENSPCCMTKSTHERIRLPFIRALFDMRKMLGKLRDDVVGTVGRTTVHHDDFKVAVALGNETRKRVTKPSRLIETRHDNRNTLGMRKAHDDVPSRFER